MEIIREHFLIEINKLREQYQVHEFQSSEEVGISSHKQAEYLDKL
jgi:hypothetical protein